MDWEVRHPEVCRKGDVGPEVADLICPGPMGESSLTEDTTLCPKAVPAGSVDHTWKRKFKLENTVKMELIIKNIFKYKCAVF